MMWIGIVIVAIASAFWMAGGPESRPEPDTRQPEAISLLGEALYPMALTAEKEQEYRQNLAEAERRHQDDPKSEDAIIWFGRRLAYLGRYRDAIDVYSKGLREHPESAALLRHRGHRYISIRNFDQAVADLSRAAELISGTADSMEPDGQPNAANQPTSTLHTNIYYHLGLAHYLRGEFEEAANAYRQCMGASRNDDMRVATTHWLYMTLRRAGRDDEAASLLAPISADMNVLENTAYHKLTLMYKGELAAESLLEGVEPDSIDYATIAYGVGNWHYYNGEPDRAREVLENIITGPAWPAFGHIAAEADLRRMRDDVTQRRKDANE